MVPLFIVSLYFALTCVSCAGLPAGAPAPAGGQAEADDPGRHIIMIEQEINDPLVRREINKLIRRPPAREIFFDAGVNRLEYQQIDMVMQEWKWNESECILDTRMALPLAAQGGEYTVSGGLLYYRPLFSPFRWFWGGGASLSAPFFPFVDRDANNVQPAGRLDFSPHALAGIDVSGVFNVALALGLHVGYYDYKQIMEISIPSLGRESAALRARVLGFGIAFMPRARFNISETVYLGVRADILYDFAGVTPVVEKPEAEGGVYNQYNYYFKGNFAVKYGLYAGVYFHNRPVFRPFGQRSAAEETPAESE